MAITIDGDNGISGVNGSATTPALQGTDSNTGIVFGTDEVQIATGGSTRATVDSSGNLGVGTSSPSALLHISKTVNSGDVGLIVQNTGTSSQTASVYLNKGSGGEPDHRIQNDTGGNLTFARGTDESSYTEQMRLDSSGRLIVGKTATSFHLGGSVFFPDGEVNITRDASVPLFINRTSSDGQLISFCQDGTAEGNISVSGTTVSIQGAHLSRWSQLAGGAARTEILRGTVLSNLDEMCEWGEEDNEQLNRMKVSDVEGDPNVAGVFQGWDDDDDTYTNDLNCAMTGDFVIRIAQGTTVARGDLLMSAGDGTAKPQDDDIVRSKTIAKVTSTTVSTTYSDGSYCVPCVLMAC